MDHKDYIKPRALEAFKEFLAKYEKGEVRDFTLFIDDCQLTLKPLGLNRFSPQGQKLGHQAERPVSQPKRLAFGNERCLFVQPCARISAA